MRDAMRRSRLVDEPCHPALLVARLELVAGLFADPELAAQVRHAFARLQSAEKLHPFAHWVAHFPGHWQPPAASPYQSSPMCLDCFLTYVPGLYLDVHDHVHDYDYDYDYAYDYGLWIWS